MSHVKICWNRAVKQVEKRQAVVEALLLARSVRSVNSVSFWLEDPDVISAGQADAAIGETVAECRRWLVEASAFEASNGRESLLDRAHPFWIEKLEPARRRAGHIGTRQLVAA